MFILGGLPLLCILIKLRGAGAALCEVVGCGESWNDSSCHPGRMSRAVPQICADRTFMKRMTGNFLREPWRIGLGAIDAECSGKKNRQGNQEKSHEDVCLTHMTSGIQWQAMEAHKKGLLGLPSCKLSSHKKEFGLQQFFSSLRIMSGAPRHVLWRKTRVCSCWPSNVKSRSEKSCSWIAAFKNVLVSSRCTFFNREHYSGQNWSIFCSVYGKNVDGIFIC